MEIIPPLDPIPSGLVERGRGRDHNNNIRLLPSNGKLMPNAIRIHCTNLLPRLQLIVHYVLYYSFQPKRTFVDRWSISLPLFAPLCLASPPQGKKLQTNLDETSGKKVARRASWKWRRRYEWDLSAWRSASGWTGSVDWRTTPFNSMPLPSFYSSSSSSLPAHIQFSSFNHRVRRRFCMLEFNGNSERVSIHPTVSHALPNQSNLFSQAPTYSTKSARFPPIKQRRKSSAKISISKCLVWLISLRDGKYEREIGGR